MQQEIRDVPQAAARPPEHLTYEEFLEWTDEDTHAEWVDGKVVFMSPVSRRHQIVRRFLLELMWGFVRRRRLGEVMDDPFQMKLGADQPGRAPDVMSGAASRRTSSFRCALIRRRCPRSAWRSAPTTRRPNCCG